MSPELQSRVDEAVAGLVLMAPFLFDPRPAATVTNAAQLIRDLVAEIERLSASESTGGEVKPMKLLGYANASRIRMTCASKPGGAHLGQVAIYAGESVDPMESQGLENLMWKEDRL